MYFLRWIKICRKKRSSGEYAMKNEQDRMENVEWLFEKHFIVDFRSRLNVLEMLTTLFWSKLDLNLLILLIVCFLFFGFIRFNDHFGYGISTNALLIMQGKHDGLQLKYCLWMKIALIKAALRWWKWYEFEPMKKKIENIYRSKDKW